MPLVIESQHEHLWVPRGVNSPVVDGAALLLLGTCCSSYRSQVKKTNMVICCSTLARNISRWLSWSYLTPSIVAEDQDFPCSVKPWWWHMNEREVLYWSEGTYGSLLKLCMEVHQGRCKEISNQDLYREPRHMSHEIQEEGGKMRRKEFGKEMLGSAS